MTQMYKREFLQHALALSRWTSAHGAESGLDPSTLALDIRAGGRTVRFFPQFIVDDGKGVLHYSPFLSGRLAGFVGWLPYFNKVWPIGQDKLAFKEHVARAGLGTPRWTTNPAETGGAFIVKARRSTFGRGIRGPFEKGFATALGDGEYCEQFIVGQLLKAMFWNADLVAVELIDMPAIRGDGRRTLREWIQLRLGASSAWPDGLDELAAVQGLTLDDVVPAERAVLIDYRWVSPLHAGTGADLDALERIAGGPLESQLHAAGASCWNAIPEAIREGTAFSLDGVVDAEGRLWLLEANCNPQLHPAIYPRMFDTTFTERSQPALALTET